MPEPKMIRAVMETICPHCSKKILVSLRSYSSSIDWTLKEETLQAAKNKLMEGVKEITFNDPNKKKEILSWVEQEDFIIGPEEVSPILDQIIKDNGKKDDVKEDTNK